MRFGEAPYLALVRGTGAWTARFDLAGVHRRAVDVSADDRVRGGGGLCDAADDLRRLDLASEVRERYRRVVALLHLQHAPVDRTPVQPGWRPGLQPPQCEPELRQRGRQAA